MDEHTRKRNFIDITSESNSSSYNNEKLASLRSVLGNDVENSQLERLLAIHNDNLELAANAYFNDPRTGTTPPIDLMNRDTIASPLPSKRHNQKAKGQSKPRTLTATFSQPSHRYYIGDTVVTGKSRPNVTTQWINVIIIFVAYLYRLGDLQWFKSSSAG